MTQRVGALGKLVSRVQQRALSVLVIVATAGGTFGLAGANAAHAQSDQVYKVSGVSVTARGKTADDAKTRAVAGGRAKALQQVFRRLTRKQDHPRLPRPTGPEAANVLLGFEVEDEQLAPTVYRGRITYSFKRDEVHQLLQAASVPFVLGAGKRVLMLAVWHQTGQPMMLWDEPNPWREAWDGLSDADTLMTYVRAEGDLSDLQAIAGDTAVRMDRTALGKIARKYDAEIVLVSYARPTGKLVRINVRGFTVATGRIFQVDNLTAQNSKAGLSVAAERLAAAYENEWKEANLISDATTATLTASAPLSGYAYWIKLRDGLSAVPLVKRYRVLNLSPTEATLAITHIGSQARLVAALREANIILENGPVTDTGETTMRLRLVGTPAPTAPATPPPGTGPDPNRPDDATKAPDAPDSARVKPLVPVLPTPRATDQ